MRRFDSRSEITPAVIAHLIEELGPSSCRYFDRSGLFAEKEVEIHGLPALIEKITQELDYQEEIARSALTLQKHRRSGAGLQTYYWEIDLNSAGLVHRQKYCTIDLVLDPEDLACGRVLFPTIVLKCRKGHFKVWGVLNQAEALEAVKVLLDW